MSKGKINVSVDNIFPLIKKFLYSDHEIFLRELISNATDATLKLKHLTNIGESKIEYGNPNIEIKIDKDGKKLHFPNCFANQGNHFHSNFDALRRGKNSVGRSHFQVYS